MSPKDRSREELPDDDVRIEITRSSTHPVEYADAAILACREAWAEIVREWESTR